MTHPAIERFLQAQEYSGNPALRSVMEAVTCTDEGNMKLVVETDDLRDALARAIKMVGTPAFMPVLSHVLLVTHHNSLLLTAADMQTGLSVSIPAEVQCSGAYTVSARLLLECARALPSRELLTIEVKESRLVLTCATQTFQIKESGPACHYPSLWRKFNGDTACVMSSNVLRQALQEVLLPTLDTVCLHVRENLIELVATNGQCLARRTMRPASTQVGVQTNIQVPVEPMRSLAKVLPKQGEVLIAWEKSRVIFQVDHVQVAARLIEWASPDYAHLLSLAATTTFLLEHRDLQQMLKSCKPFSKEIALSYHQGSVTLQASHQKLGQVSGTVSVPIVGKSGQIILHRQHLTDIVKCAKTLTFCISDSPNPIIIVPDERENYLFVLGSFLP